MRLETGVIARAALILATAAFSTAAFAAPQWCTGTIAQLWIDAGGNVMAYPSWRADHVRICNVNDSVTTSNGIPVTPTTCLGWAALLRSAIQNQKATIIYYNEAPTCSSLPTYGSAPVPYYVMLTQ